MSDFTGWKAVTGPDGKPLEFDGDITGMVALGDRVFVFTKTSTYVVAQETRWFKFKRWLRKRVAWVSRKQG